MINNGITHAKTSCPTIVDHKEKERIIKIQNDVSCLKYIFYYANIYNYSISWFPNVDITHLGILPEEWLITNLRTCRTFMIIHIRSTELLQVTQQARHEPKFAQKNFNKELVDDLNLKENKWLIYCIIKKKNCIHEHNFKKLLNEYLYKPWKRVGPATAVPGILTLKILYIPGKCIGAGP